MLSLLFSQQIIFPHKFKNTFGHCLHGNVIGTEVESHRMIESETHRLPMFPQRIGPGSQYTIQAGIKITIESVPVENQTDYSTGKL